MKKNQNKIKIKDKNKKQKKDYLLIIFIIILLISLILNLDYLNKKKYNSDLKIKVLGFKKINTSVFAELLTNKNGFKCNFTFNITNKNYFNRKKEINKVINIKDFYLNKTKNNKYLIKLDLPYGENDIFFRYNCTYLKEKDNQDLIKKNK